MCRLIYTTDSGPYLRLSLLPIRELFVRRETYLFGRLKLRTVEVPYISPLC